MACLTKSRFLSGLQCHKRLWFEIQQPLEEAVEPDPAVLLGRSFDKVVQRLHPGVVISLELGLPAAIEQTSQMLAQAGGIPAVMHQPAFRVGNLAFIADVLRHVDNEFELIEVKATTQVKDVHIPDAAFQTLVLSNSGTPPKRVFIGHINNQFVLREKDRYEGILVESDVTQEVMACLPAVAAQADTFLRLLAEGSAPTVDVGDHCSTPYECAFRDRCHAHLPAGPDYPVKSLPGGGKTTLALIDEGYADIREIPDGRLTSEMHRRVHQATVTGVPYFDAAATVDLRKLKYPFSYLDFETMGFAVPELIGSRPYEQLPFQWSVHVEASATNLRHFEYLAIESFGDFAELAERLVAAIPAVGPVFAYNASFERGILDKLADLLPGHSTALRAIAGRLVDLLPITRQAYYHRDMQGSWSIKNVMPTIDPSLDYRLRGEVQEGMAAQAAFLELRNPNIEPPRAAEVRAALLDYCQHDTWVMVVLRRFLCGQALGIGD